MAPRRTAGDASSASDESDRTGAHRAPGPKALDVVAELAGEDLEPPARFQVAEATSTACPCCSRAPATRARTASRSSAQRRRAADLWRLLLSFPEVVAVRSRRAGHAAPRDGVPALRQRHRTGRSDPVSAGLGWAVSLEQGRVHRSRGDRRDPRAGPRRKLVGLTVAEAIPRHGYPVLHGDEQVGTVASGTFSPTLGHGIATAYVPAALSDAGNACSRWPYVARRSRRSSRGRRSCEETSLSRDRRVARDVARRDNERKANAMYPSDLKYTKEHEWVRASGDTPSIGITDFAQDQLGEVVYVDLPAEGDEIVAGETFGEIESVKSVSELYAPVSPARSSRSTMLLATRPRP